MIRKAIVIATTPTPSLWLQNLLNSIEGEARYPILILSDYNWEMGKIRYIRDHTLIDEFLLLQESVEIKDREYFPVIFEKYEGQSVKFHPGCTSYICKYRREVLNQLTLPIIQTKDESVYYETEFHRQYQAIEEMQLLPCDIDDSPNNFETKFGRKSLVVKSPFLWKYKTSIWH